MKFRTLVSLLILSNLVSCSESTARRPKRRGTTNFYKEVIQNNKKLNRLEKNKLESWIKEDSIHEYQESTSGYWYYYEKKDSIQTITPKVADVVEIEFDIKEINGAVIYNKMKRFYKVDKEDFIPALQDGIKLMKKGETIIFVIPSYRAFGVSGDGNKIGINQPIKSTVKLIDIKTNHQ